MIPHLVYYQLVILVLVWLCVMLPHLWPTPSSGVPKSRHSAQRPSFWCIFIGKTRHTACPGAAAGAGARRAD